MSNTPHGGAARDKLHAQMQTLLAGHTLETTMAATLDSLAVGVVLASENLERADRLCDQLARDMKKVIRENWDYVKSQAPHFPVAGGTA